MDSSPSRLGRSMQGSPSKQLLQPSPSKALGTSQSTQKLQQPPQERASTPSSSMRSALTSSGKVGSRVRLVEPAESSSPSLAKSKSATKNKGVKKGTKKNAKVQEPPVEVPVPVKEEPAPPKGPIRFSAPPLLTELCLRCIVTNFKEHPLILSSSFGIPKRFVAKVVELLPTSLPPEISAVNLCGPESEPYWRNCCNTKWQNLDVTMHGSEWKRAYFESMLRLLLEEYTSTKDKSEILRFMDVARDYIFYLTITQLLSHFDLKLIFSHLVNLVGINLSYGARNLGTNFEFAQFGIKAKDCEDLCFSLRATHTLSTLALPNNLIDDELLRIIVSGLKENCTVTSLDFSHNKIGDEGIRSLCELLQNKDCIIANLELTNNQIYSEGGKLLGMTLQTNCSLEQLSLRRNRLEDKGGVALFDGLKLNNTIMRLNISSNNLGEESARSLSELIWIKKPSLLYLDLTNNPFGKKGAENFEGIDRNEFVLEFDVRGCEVGKECEDYIANWIKRNEKSMSQGTEKSEKSGSKESKSKENGRPATSENPNPPKT
eukprot:Phypoly_transcript_06469.p1 GENE.Phypoly_transcript_06469~~Phypoly_transcript_06469.p1  ORF type:complete len:577 (+),score=75.10 Phypoly_transcript_06469:98-1732(+)